MKRVLKWVAITVGIVWTVSMVVLLVVLDWSFSDLVSLLEFVGIYGGVVGWTLVAGSLIIVIVFAYWFWEKCLPALQSWVEGFQGVQVPEEDRVQIPEEDKVQVAETPGASVVADNDELSGRGLLLGCPNCGLELTVGSEVCLACGALFSGYTSPRSAKLAYRLAGWLIWIPATVGRLIIRLIFFWWR